MKPDSLEFLFIALVAIGTVGLCQWIIGQRKDRREWIKVQRNEKPVTVRRSRNWRWF